MMMMVADSCNACATANCWIQLCARMHDNDLPFTLCRLSGMTSCIMSCHVSEQVMPHTSLRQYIDVLLTPAHTCLCICVLIRKRTAKMSPRSLAPYLMNRRHRVKALVPLVKTQSQAMTGSRPRGQKSKGQQELCFIRSRWCSLCASAFLVVNDTDYDILQYEKNSLKPKCCTECVKRCCLHLFHTFIARVLRWYTFI